MRQHLRHRRQALFGVVLQAPADQVLRQLRRHRPAGRAALPLLLPLLLKHKRQALVVDLGPVAQREAGPLVVKDVVVRAVDLREERPPRAELVQDAAKTPHVKLGLRRREHLARRAQRRGNVARARRDGGRGCCCCCCCCCRAVAAAAATAAATALALLDAQQRRPRARLERADFFDELAVLVEQQSGQLGRRKRRRVLAPHGPPDRRRRVQIDQLPHPADAHDVARFDVAVHHAGVGVHVVQRPSQVGEHDAGFVDAVAGESFGADDLVEVALGARHDDGELGAGRVALPGGGAREGAGGSGGGA